MAAYPHEADLERKFTVFSRFDEKVELFESREGRILLPRAVCPLGLEDRRVEGPPVQIQSLVQFREGQEAPVKQAGQLLEQGQSFILQAGTGFGKTVMACDLLARIGRRTLIVIPKDDLMTQWWEALLEFTDLTPGDIGVIRQDQMGVSGTKVVLGMLHSLSKRDRYPAWIRKEFGFVIWDEVHRIGAETFSRTASMFPARLRMGLSATPKRQDGKEFVFLAHLGPVRVKAALTPMVPRVLQIPTNWHCPRVPKNGRVVRMPHTFGRVTNVTTRMAKDEARNLLICKMAYAAWKKGRNLVVFSEFLKHLDLIRSGLLAMGVPTKDMGKYIGGMKQAERDQSASRKIVLATYKMASEGTDYPWWDACLLAIPRADVEQIVGRILREYPDKPQPVVLDLQDTDSPVFQGYARGREKIYRRLGASYARARV